MTSVSDSANVRLDTWKEIASFLRCDERTAKRWESDRQLPVHRLPGGSRSKVFAYAAELRVWLDGVAGGPALEPLDEDLAPVSGDVHAPTSEAATTARPALSRWLVITCALAGMIAAIGLVTLASGNGGSVRPAESPAPSAASHQIDPAAVSLYLGGLHDWNTRTPAGLARAVDEFTQAIVREPGYAPAYVGLANCYNLLREYTLMPPQEAYPRAKAAAERAIALDDRLAGGHNALAFVDAYWSWDNVAAEREFRRALQLEPSSAQSHHWYGTFLLHLGRTREALKEIETAQSLDPDSSAILADKAWVLGQVGRHDEAVAILTQMEHTNPELLSPHRYLSAIYLTNGDTRRYLVELRAWGERLKDPTGLQIADAGVRGAAAGGHRGMLEAMLAVREKLYAQGKLPAFDLAENNAWLGNRDQALAYLKLALARREEGVSSLGTNAAFQSVRSTPQFQAALKTAGLPNA